MLPPFAVHGTQIFHGNLVSCTALFWCGLFFYRPLTPPWLLFIAGCELWAENYLLIISYSLFIAHC